MGGGQDGGRWSAISRRRFSSVFSRALRVSRARGPVAASLRACTKDSVVVRDGVRVLQGHTYKRKLGAVSVATSKEVGSSAAMCQLGVIRGCRGEPGVHRRRRRAKTPVTDDSGRGQQCARCFPHKAAYPGQTLRAKPSRLGFLGKLWPAPSKQVAPRGAACGTRFAVVRRRCLPGSGLLGPSCHGLGLHSGPRTGGHV